MGDKQILSEIDWQKVGQLLPVIVQNVNTAEVLMLGYMNQAALEKTLAEKRVTFFSRTKQRLWTKGETSGNFLQLVDYSLDCDRDSLLIMANPLGKTCHQGTDSCFSPISAHIDWVFFSKLEQLIQQRKGTDPSSSYTASLYAKGTKRIAQKVGEEGVETALAATVEDQAETISEAADLVYHLTVLLQNANLNWSAVIEKLKQRHQ
ncbi:bifunctional phosphoribosyl-AMP cyclohydrolase/phosphoribosyl-ATP diphosphatase [Mergibacter septicus]|uniref:bifunctional phosphoribosyl-AMP cyclohydrolase/phosphoribosyl-ATP diphosphatase HisIE n=1 Tax=Mergibacter septicus TaxID=221402 RepID=UPI0011791F58|nr:bifunctional phosphoribosyl-AMP cyclohydrolase/phosphoribosyl-ATP diphosphatase HisIE [Mergibacter septicus]AWX13537.1 bifunctional phosphoribosyl-AMP cyclohydrolase/phosphoribosyl-ATP diphosphatase [Mergibacter septicus]